MAAASTVSTSLRTRAANPIVDDPAIAGSSTAARIAPQLRSLLVPLGSLELHPRNPRRGDVAAVAASLERFGQQKPVVVQASTGYVVAGNHLLRAARRLGWAEIAASVVELDDAAAVAYMLADNRTADLGGYDDALLAAILAEQQAEDNLAATGYDADAVAALLAAAGLEDGRDPDAAPDLPAEAEVYVRPGELWALGRHRLLCGDATDPAAVARLLDGPADLVWTDPPYSLAYTGKTRRALTIANDDLGPEGTRALVASALRLAPLRPGGCFYVAAPTRPDLLAAFRADSSSSISRSARLSIGYIAKSHFAATKVALGSFPRGYGRASAKTRPEVVLNRKSWPQCVSRPNVMEASAFASIIRCPTHEGRRIRCCLL